MTYCTLDKLSGIITDDEPPQEIADYMEEHGIDLFVTK
jgi:DeoR/GlpR family transcriptional regulator of sugar metabolism